MKTKNNKDDFIRKLSSMSPEDINILIREKGKKPKLVNPFIKITNEENN